MGEVPLWVYIVGFVAVVFALPFAFARYHDRQQRQRDEQEAAARQPLPPSEEQE